MKIYDLSLCPFSDRNGSYGGLAGRKDGILINGERWIIKYPKTTMGMKDVPISYTTSPLNEFVASHIYGILGYSVHETQLGIRNNKLVVACKDFCNDNTRLMEMRTIKNYANEQLSEKLDREFAGTGDGHIINLNEMLLHLKYNEILCSIPKIEEYFWNMCVVDLYLKNGDRNNGNWGILRSSNSSDVPAPIFDNGGSFIDKADEEKYMKVLQPDRIQTSATNFRTVYGIETKVDNPDSLKQLNANDFIEYSMQFPKFRTALIKNIPLISKNEEMINAFIRDIPNSVENIPVCSEVQKRYFIETLKIRMDYLLIPAYEKVISAEKDKTADMNSIEYASALLDGKIEDKRANLSGSPKQDRLQNLSRTER